MSKSKFLLAWSAIFFGFFLMIHFSYGATPLEPEFTTDQSADRVVESRGNHIFPFTLDVGSTTALAVYNVLPDSNTLTFREKAWHKATVINNNNGFQLQVGTWAFKAADNAHYFIIQASATEVILNHDDLYIKYAVNGTSLPVRGRIERE